MQCLEVFAREQIRENKFQNLSALVEFIIRVSVALERETIRGTGMLLNVTSCDIRLFPK